MRIIITITFLLMSFMSGNTIAFETGPMHRAMLYLEIPLDGTESDQDMVGFGFRLDNIESTQQGIYTDYPMNNPTALMDFRMNKQGIEGIYFSGTDYLQKFRVYRQNQQQGSGEQETAEDGIGATISEAMKAAPLGVYIGIGLGVGLLLGVGD